MRLAKECMRGEARSSGEDLPSREAAGDEAVGIRGLRTGRYDHVVGIGQDEDAEIRALGDPIHRSDRIEWILVAGKILVCPKLGEVGADRHEGRGENHAADIIAEGKKRGGSVSALRVTDEMQAPIAVPGFDRVQRRRNDGDLVRGATFGMFARGAVGAGPPEQNIRQADMLRPTGAGGLLLGRTRFEVNFLGRYLPATIARDNIRG